MKTPIVMAAFGTATKAMDTYSFIDRICKRRFPDHPIYWSFSSRVLRDKSNKERNTRMQQPRDILSDLKEKGHGWAVVQSLHMMCGHEFYRLVDEVRQCDIRTAIGLPLLTEPRDYRVIADALNREFRDCRDEAIVLIGHGTDHPGWCTYVALDYLFRRNGGPPIYVGVFEEGWPTMESVVSEIQRAGFGRVRLIPFMLVAGMHFEEDMSGKEDSYKQAFEAAGIQVNLTSRGMGFHEHIIDIFCRHIREALDVIPESAGPEVRDQKETP